MLQKILVVIIGLVMSVVGALTPDGLVASTNDGDGHGLAANTAEETLATVRTSDGQAFARISVLWIEVDGRRVTEDAWGTGEVDEIRFKVGVKDVDAVALALGDKIVQLHPTDIITVRMFRGDFSYRGIGTPLSSVQLQGSVKTTSLNEGAISQRVLTQRGDLDLAGLHQAESNPGDESKVAYVVLTTGEKVDTLAVEDGGARLFTEEVAIASDAKNEPGNLLAKWVKLDGKLVREYTWGDGPVGKIEFEPADGPTRSVVLAFNGEVSEVATGERVLIQDFVGEYLVYQVSGGMMRVRLDGYAAKYETGNAIAIPTIGGSGAPLPNMEFAPHSPKTTDTVLFHDASQDDGIIVFRQWDFGDGTPMIPALEDPTHRFAKPGSYDVKLTVTDNDLKESNVTQTIVVRNAEPVSDFDFSPKVVTTDTLVSFTDQSFDGDGSLANWTWDFGDGVTNHSRSPAHRFSRGGNVTVTLSTVDDMGGRSSLSKVVIVRNSPPLAGFTFNKSMPLTLDAVQFTDNSSDRDGVVVRWNWSFGDGTFASGSNPVHAFPRPGVFTVTLTVTDDGGDSDTVSTTIIVQNRPPFADFTYHPGDQPASVPITFTSSSTDPDGTILTHVWDFGDGAREMRGAVVSHQFPRAGEFNVTLTVTDNTLGASSVMRTVNVSNSGPRANFIIGPSPGYRGTEVTFSDISVDPDGDAIVNWTWDFGDGASDYGRVVYHSFNTLGTKTVTLTVKDARNGTSTVSRPHRVLNRPPSIAVNFTPTHPIAGVNVDFTGVGIDPDLPGGEITFEWSFSDKEKRIGPLVHRTFPRAGNYSVSVKARDSEGGESSPVIMGFRVDHARPAVNFNWTPDVPLKAQQIQFNDLTTTTPDAPIREWRWHFGVGPSSTSNAPNPKFAYTTNGTFTVTLEVIDVNNMSNATSKDIFVNLEPSARFALEPFENIQLNQGVQFTDASIDEDGSVVNWSWEFGDGNTSFVRHPLHPGYTKPASYKVNLSIRDDRGATNRTSLTIDVANHAPVARWVHTTLGLPQERGIPVYFDSSESFDPDAQPITAWSWSFGDGTLPTNVSDPQHTFQRSGFHTVDLTVADGLKTSSVVVGESRQTLRVGANHSVTLHITATMPDQSVADLTQDIYTIAVRLNGQEIPLSFYEDDGKAVNVSITKDRWLHGQTATVSITADHLIGRNELPARLEDGRLVVDVPFRLRMGTNVFLTPEGGVRDPLLWPLNNATGQNLTGKDSDFFGDPLYHDMFEKPHGTGYLEYTDHQAAAFQKVDIEARWVPLRLVQGLRDQLEDADNTNNALLGWCKAGNATTRANGTFVWAFDGLSTCYLNSFGGGIYPVGRWEVRARALPTTAEFSVSEVRVFYVDPTGGLLLKTLGPTLA